MTSLFPRFVTILLVMGIQAGALAQERRPVGRITRPVDGAIINTNAIRIVAEQVPGSATPHKVVFFAEIANPTGDLPVHTMLGVDSTAPFELIWDCSSVLDQCYFGLQLYAHLVGPDVQYTQTGRVCVVLDRNPAHSPARLTSSHAAVFPDIDGVIDDTRSPSAVIRNDDNRYLVFSSWNSNELYFAFQVTDSSLYAATSSGDSLLRDWDSLLISDPLHRKLALWQDDCIGLFFDTDHSRSELFDTSDRFLYLAPTGAVHASRLDSKTGRRYNWGKRIRCASSLQDTTRTGFDTGAATYTLECAIPWASLGVSPDDRDSVGIDIYLVDRERAQGKRITARWAGSAHNHLNTSEWGTLSLSGGPRPFHGALAVFAAMAAGIGAAALLWLLPTGKTGHSTRKTPAAESRPPLPASQRALLDAAIAYMTLHAGDPELSKEPVARHLHISPRYMSNFFKRGTGKHFSGFLNEIRIERSCELLRDGSQSVTEVALAVGYKSLNHFITVFKALKGTTPKQYQISCRKR